MGNLYTPFFFSNLSFLELLDSIYKYRKINPRSVSKFKIAIKMRYIDNEINPIATYLLKRMDILRVSKDPTLTWTQKFDRCWNVIGTDWVIFDENEEPSEEDLLECLRVLIKIKARWKKIRPLTEPEKEYFHKILEPEKEPEEEPRYAQITKSANYRKSGRQL